MSRAPLTVMFTDIEGSTALWDQHESEMRSAHREHHRILCETLPRFGGRIVKDLGDGFMVVFLDPTQAVRAAAAAQQVLHETEWPASIGEIKVRMAMSTGVVEEREDDYYGADVNKASRLESISHGGQIVMSETTRSLITGHLDDGFETKDLGQQRLKGVTDPVQVYQLIAPNLPVDFPPLKSATPKGRGLPGFTTSFLGRDQELEQISALLDDGARLVTLLGPGGIGKTRLAVETAGLLEPHMAGGAFFADLAPVGSVDEFSLAFAEAVGVHLEGTADVFDLIAESLTEPTLVVVDNFEHLIDASPSLANLIRQNETLKLLATSRTPLGVSGEQVFRVSPLHVGSNGGPSPAVALFRDRAQAHGALLTADDEEAIRSICQRLDGLPLAIELVAARTRMFSAGEIDRMLATSLDALDSGGADLPERHRTIRNTIDWSLQTLSDSQRTLFARLSALPAGADLETLELVCCEGLEGSVIDNLTALVDNSLVYPVTDLPGGTRFRQLSLLREYGSELLAQAGETEDTLDRLIDRYVQVSPRMREGLQERTAYEAHIVAEHANLVTALEWSLQRQRGAEMARVLVDIWIYFFNGDRVSTALDWLREARAQADTAYLDFLAGFLAFQTGDFPAVNENMTKALAGFEAVGDNRGLALTRLFASVAEEDLVKARAMLESAEETFGEIGDRVGKYVVLVFQSIIDFQEGDIAASMEKRNIALRDLERTDFEILIAWTEWNLALSHLALEQRGQAAAFLASAFDYMANDGNHEGIASMAQIIAVIEVLEGRQERAAWLLGASAAIFDRIGVAPWYEAMVQVEPAIDTLKTELGDDEYERLFAEGSTANLSETVDLTYETVGDQAQIATLA